jgi:tetratricopeptide (TPR) repeat protein
MPNTSFLDLQASIANQICLANNNLVESISLLLEQSQNSRKSNNWIRLEEISISILQTLFKGNSLKDETLKQVVINYLSSIIGTGDFLTSLSSKDRDKYKQGLEKLNEFLDKKPHLFNSIDPIIQSGREIALLALEPTPQNRNKISKNLRAIARPDLAVIICMQILEVTRLNYYTLTVLCGAYCDLGYFDKAIESAEKALKHDPGFGKTFVLNSLVRAHTLKFKTNGDFSEITTALEYAHQSIDLKLDSYSANAYIAAAVASMIDYEIENAKAVLAKAEPDLRVADINAIIQGAKAAQALSPNSVGIEIIDELDDDGFFGVSDSLLDLVIRDEGFTPQIEDVRQMIPRFKSGGWFLQGLCNVPCPKCEKIALHSYRKHFGRYGKEMHYWGLVCDVCKTATDSKDFEKKSFTFISTDLEKNYPVVELCSHCNPSQVLQD